MYNIQRVWAQLTVLLVCTASVLAGELALDQSEPEEQSSSVDVYVMMIMLKKMTTTITIMTKKVIKKMIMMITDMDTKVMHMVSLTHIFG